MKIYVKAATEKHNAKSACNLVIKYLEDLGFKQVNYWARGSGKKGLSSGSVRLTYRFNPYTDEDLANHAKSLMEMYPEEFPTYESTLRCTLAEVKRREYSNFALLQELYGDAGEEEGHDPFSHSGGGYANLDNALISDIKEFLSDSGYSDAIVKRSASGLHGIKEDLEIIILVPTAEEGI